MEVFSGLVRSSLVLWCTDNALMKSWWCADDAWVSYLISLKPQLFKNIAHVGSFQNFVFVFLCLCLCLSLCLCLCLCLCLSLCQDFNLPDTTADFGGKHNYPPLLNGQRLEESAAEDSNFKKNFFEEDSSNDKFTAGWVSARTFEKFRCCKYISQIRTNICEDKTWE